jgi:hypothetical protein
MTTCSGGVGIAGEFQNDSAELNWGIETNGLQASWEIIPTKASYLIGDRVDVFLHVRNVSTNTIRMLTCTNINDEVLSVRDEDGGQQRVALGRSGRAKMRNMTCAPGETLLFKAMGIRFLAAELPKPERFFAYQMRCRPGRYWIKYAFFLPNPLVMSRKEAHDYKNTGMFPSRIGNWVGELETGEAAVTILSPQEQE